jgi:hypothetical protein
MDREYLFYQYVKYARHHDESLRCGVSTKEKVATENHRQQQIFS